MWLGKAKVPEEDRLFVSKYHVYQIYPRVPNATCPNMCYVISKRLKERQQLHKTQIQIDSIYPMNRMITKKAKTNEVTKFVQHAPPLVTKSRLSSQKRRVEKLPLTAQQS